MSRKKKGQVKYDSIGLASCVECGRIVYVVRYLGDDNARVFSINPDAIAWLEQHVPGWPEMEIRQEVSVRRYGGVPEYHRATCPFEIVMRSRQPDSI